MLLGKGSQSMIYRLVKEINSCLSNNCPMAALMAALTLPDICGKAKYPELEKHTKQRYIRWFDEYIGKYEHDEEHIEKGMPYFSGEVCYSLRCSLMHQGNPNVDYDKDMDYFELIWQEHEGCHVSISSAEAEIVTVEGKEKAIHKRYSVNIRDICFKLCALATYYYNAHKEEFNFFNYNISNMDFRTKEAFRIK